jgi:pyridoxal phosphate enzyme (YggS family)
LSVSVSTAASTGKHRRSGSIAGCYNRAVSSTASTLAVSLESVRTRIAAAAHRSGRPAASVTLVAVTKTVPPEAIREAYRLGVRHFGENRVQEREAKRPALGELREAVWHMIGHLQRNKVRRAIELFDRLDSLDSLQLAEKLEAVAAERGVRVSVLIEVRLAPEETKAGIEPEALPALAAHVLRLPHLELDGLMTVPPFCPDPEQVRPYFRRLRELRDRLAAQLGRPLPRLSMGMSHDFEVAIEEGATEIRLGTALFGLRQP